MATTKRGAAPGWPTLENVATAAAALAGHIREHLPIKGEAPPPSGGPDGGPRDWPATGLLARWSGLRLALFAWDEQHPRPPVQALAGDAIVRAAALEKIRRGFDRVSRHYGLDRLAAGEEVEEAIMEIDPAAVRCLEWGADRLLPLAPVLPTSQIPPPRKTPWNKGKCSKAVKKVVALLRKGMSPSDIVVELRDAGITMNERQISNIKHRAKKADRL